MSAPEGGRIVVVAPSYAHARLELTELHPNSWQYVARVEQLRGMPRGLRLLVLGPLTGARADMVDEALTLRGFERVELGTVAPRAAARAAARAAVVEAYGERPGS